MADQLHTNRIALVAGAGGIIGNGVVHALKAEGWTIRALGRRAIPGVDTITADLLDAAATATALAAARDTTHLFYAAYTPRPDLPAEVAANGPMLENLLVGLRQVAAPLRHATLYQGAKVYGVHLGLVTAPFYEDTPRHLPPNFYFTQADILAHNAREAGFAWTIIRPDVVVGDVAGNPMNIALVIGTYAAICKATHTPFRFPGSTTTYSGVFAQLTDARLLGRASLWAATADAARDQAFNYVHEPFRWERVWTQLAEALGLEVGPPLHLTLSRHMADKAPLWSALAREHGLSDTPYDRLVGWAFGDFVFNTEFDLISDMGKIRQAGFNETTDNATCILAAIRRLQGARILPP